MQRTNLKTKKMQKLKYHEITSNKQSTNKMAALLQTNIDCDAINTQWDLKLQHQKKNLVPIDKQSTDSQERCRYNGSNF